MSRYQVLHDEKGMAFGKDACGLFLQIWHRAKGPLRRKVQDAVGPENEALLVNKKEKIHSDFTEEEMLRLISHHGFTLAECEISAHIGRSKREAECAQSDDDRQLFELFTSAARARRAPIC